MLLFKMFKKLVNWPRNQKILQIIYIIILPIQYMNIYCLYNQT